MCTSSFQHRPKVETAVDLSLPITTRPQSAIIDGLTFNFLLYVIGPYQKFGSGIGLVFLGKGNVVMFFLFVFHHVED